MRTETTKRKTARMWRETTEAVRRRTGNKFNNNRWDWILPGVRTEGVSDSERRFTSFPFTLLQDLYSSRVHS